MKEDFCDLEVILLSGYIDQEEVDHYKLSQIGEMHNDHYVYSNKDYTMVLKEYYNTDKYLVKTFWNNSIDG